MRVGWLLALAAALILVACGGATDPPIDDNVAPAPDADTPAAVTPPSTPPATGPLSAGANARILLDEAASLERNGFWEDAVAVRATVLDGDLASALGPAAAATAQTDQIRLLLRLNRFADAEGQLFAARAALPSDDQPTARVHDLLEHRILTALGDLTGAERSLVRYLDQDGSAADFARLQRAQLLIQLGQSNAAADAYDTVIANPDASPLDLESALLQGGLVFENQGRFDDAVQRYQQLFDVSPWVSDDAFSLHRIGIVELARDDLVAAEAAWLQLIETYPWHWRAAEAYESLLAFGLSIDRLTAGLLLYNQNRLDDARDILTDALFGAASDADAALARFYLASIDADLGESEDAISGYLASANQDPQGRLAGDALWWAGRLLEERGQIGLAEVTYRRAAAAPIAGEFASAAAFRAALMPYVAGKLTDAENQLIKLAEQSANRADFQQAQLWLGKVRDAQGNTAGAASAYELASQTESSSYYGLRAQALLAGEIGAPTLAEPALGLINQPDPLASEKWLASQVGPEPAGISDQFTASVAWQAAIDLLQAGLQTSADDQVRLHLDRAEDDPWLLYRSGQVLGELGLTHLQLEAATAILATLPADDRHLAPNEILRWAYPRGWPTLATAQATTHQVDELLIYAVIRQESRFNPDAGSIAGALGLTQVIPPTAGDISAALDDESFHVDLLFRPERSIQYGAYYLGAQLTLFDGAPSLALAAYNGGPGNVFRWSGDNTSIDPDLFYENITFSETRLYVQLVLENYAWYQFVYRATPMPTITAAGREPAAPPTTDSAAVQVDGR
jgi:soluble lytic murein transglycosylase